MGLSMRVRRRYGFARSAHRGRYLSSTFGDGGDGGGIGFDSSDATLACTGG